MHEPEWQRFYYYSISKLNKAEPREYFTKETLQNHQNYINNGLNGKAESFDDIQPIGKPLTAAPWLRLMKKYHWSLSIDNKHFILRDYEVAYVNAESRFIYAGENQLVAARPVPRYISLFFQNKLNKNIPERIDIEFDWDKIMQAFAKFALVTPLNEPINLYLAISPDLSQVFAYLKKGHECLELKNIKPTLTDLYITGDDVNVPWPEQTKHWH